MKFLVTKMIDVEVRKLKTGVKILIKDLPPSENALGIGKRLRDSWIKRNPLPDKVSVKCKYYSVGIKFHIPIRMDIDNMVKSVLDYLTRYNVIKDDRYILRLTVDKIITKDPKYEHVEIMVKCHDYSNSR